MSRWLRVSLIGVAALGVDADSRIARSQDVPRDAGLARLSEPRIEPVEKEDSTPAQRAYLEPHEKAGRLFNIFKTGARHPKLAASFDAFAFGHINGNSSTLSPRHRELLILRIAWICRSEYVWAQHNRIARAMGFDDEELTGVRKGPDAEAWRPLESALLQAVDELRRDAFIADPTWKSLASRLNTQQLMDLVVTVGTYNTVCMMANSWGVQLDSGLQGSSNPR